MTKSEKHTSPSRLLRSSIDVIVPCYRYAHYLRECVTSVLSERELAVRVIIIDDDSPDKTPDVAQQLAREDSRVTYCRHTTNRGHIATYNEGIEWLAADYMLLLSADDYLFPGALRRAVDFMEAHPNVAFTYGLAVLTSECGLTAPPVGTAPSSNTWRLKTGLEFMNEVAGLGTKNPVATPTVIVRTQLLKQLGGYRPELPHSGDMEMWLRLAAHGDLGEYDGYVGVQRRHESNMHYAYNYLDYGLGDLTQRRAAINCLFNESAARIPDGEALRRTLLAPLAIEALKTASVAFSDGHEEAFKQHVEFARATDPAIQRSQRWKLLTFKRCLGMRLWRGFCLPMTRLLSPRHLKRG